MVIAGVVTLSAEISPPSCRGRFMTLVASCYTLGFLYTSLSALVIFQAGGGSWRWFMFMNVLPTIVALSLVVMFVPESPRKSTEVGSEQMGITINRLYTKFSNSNTSSPPLPNTNGLTEGFYLARGRLHESVEVANSLVKRFGISGQDILTEEELRRYLFQANEIGSTSFIAKEAIMKQETLWEEMGVSLLGMKQVFTNRMYRVTIPLQFTYACLTLVTGEIFDFIRFVD
jgi:MFS family permease